MNYLEQVQRTIDYMEGNLKEDINLETLAKEACFSAFYFHRIFQALVGDSAIDYLRKRRLSCAADELINSDKRILDIALEYTYNSQSAFTRAFRNAYGITPGECRKRRTLPRYFKRADLQVRLKGGIDMEPKIIVREPIQVIGAILRTTTVGNKNLSEIPKFWETCMADSLFERIPNRKNLCTLGICGDYDEATDTFGYIVGSEVTSLEEIPDGMVGKTIPAAKYAVFTAKGPIPEKVQEVWHYIYSTWLPNSGLERGETEDFELYDERCNDPIMPETDIYIPVK